SNDISGVQGVITYTATNLISNLVTMGSIIIAMILLSPFLACIALSLLPIFMLMSYKAGKLQKQTTKEAQKSQASLAVLIQETLSVSGILLVKVFGRQKYTQAQFEEENQKLSRLTVRQLMIGQWLLMFVGIFFATIPALVYLIGGLQLTKQIPVLGSSITIGTMISFVILQTRLLMPCGRLLSLQIELQGALALFERIFEYLDMPVDITDKPYALQLKPEEVRGEVTFKQVTFSYKRNEYGTLAGIKKEGGVAGNRTGTSPVSTDPSAGSSEQELPLVLKNITFSIKPGQLVALVGPSGAGKTTLTSMIARLYDVESGAVEIDGINVKDIALSSLGELIGVVTQESYLLHASIRENILYARPDATEAEVIAAAQATAIHDRIMELENGYDTIVGERGYKLSGGEKQRIAIARVVLKNPRILILDEATSSLDTLSERLVQSALETLMKGRTALVIAHRLSTILAADMILVVNKGEIIERGTHQQLLALDGLYAQLYFEQFSPLLEAAESSITQHAIGMKNRQPAWFKVVLPSFVPPEQPAFLLDTRPALPLKNRLMAFTTFSEDVREILFEKDALRLGKDSSNDIVLDGDELISAHHILLNKKDEDYYLFELDGNGGVLINGQQLASGVGHKLVDGDQISIGHRRLIFSNTPTQSLIKPRPGLSLS
ncbi:MAG: ATP-binding cassette domain-containing protein, partial [Chloroflexi bacterium]